MNGACPGPAGRRRKGRLPFDVLFEDGDLIVIDKPEGLLAVHTLLHGRAAREAQATAENLLNDYVRKGQPKSRRRVWLVHRLDRDTSGVMVFAKSGEVADSLRAHWADVTEKTYIAEVEGVMDAGQGVFESWLREDADGYRVRSVPPPKEKKGGASAEPGARPAKFARTEWRVLGRGRRGTRVEVKLKTGRKNQIRVQFAGAGHPVVGDVKYGAHRAPRMFLHSAELRLVHPRTRETLVFASPAPF